MERVVKGTYDRQLLTRVVDFHRLNNTNNGNPMWEFNTNDGTYRTGIDVSAAYEVENDLARFRTEEVVLYLSRAGSIQFWNFKADLDRFVGDVEVHQREKGYRS